MAMEKLRAAASSVPSSANSPISKERMKLILRCTLAIFSAYRADSYGSDEHAEGYKANLKAVLGQYPDDVIAHISDPRTGVQRACKWPPTIAEIVTACEVQMQHMAKLERMRNWGKATLEDRRRLEAPREERPTFEEMKAKYGEDWGLTPDPRPKPGFKTGQAPSWQEIVSLYTRDPDRIARLIRVADKYAEDRGDAPA
jgi:hypothetical protein